MTALGRSVARLLAIWRLALGRSVLVVRALGTAAIRGLGLLMTGLAVRVVLRRATRGRRIRLAAGG